MHKNIISIALAISFIFFQPSQSFALFVPSVVCGGSIHNVCVTAEPSISNPAIHPSTNTTPQATPSPSSGHNLNTSPAFDPCSTTSVQATSKKKRHKHKKSSIQKTMEQFIKFLQEIIKLLNQFIGGNITFPPAAQEPAPVNSTNPTIGDQPPVGPSIPGDISPSFNPTQNQPCAASPIPPSAVNNPSPGIPSPSSPTSSGPASVGPSITNLTSAAKIPGQILNLTNWKLTLPSGQVESPTEIKQPQLATYVNNPFFTVANGGVKFRAPVNGVTTSGSGYPRSELREMTTNGTVQAAWSSSSGTHTMIIDQAIVALASTKKDMVAGQIHDQANDILVARLETNKLLLKAGTTTGSILDPNYTLGKRFTIKFETANNQTKVYYNNSSTPIYTLSKSFSGAYFKAGAYTQSNCTTEASNLCNANNFGEVIIYNLSVTHK